MGTTAQGFPYPEPSDAVAAGADAIKALAQRIDDTVGVFAAGSVAIVGTGATSASAVVTFPPGRFTGTPITVTVCQVGLVAWATGASMTGVTIGVKRTDDGAFSGSYVVNWLAIQQ